MKVGLMHCVSMNSPTSWARQWEDWGQGAYLVEESRISLRLSAFDVVLGFVSGISLYQRLHTFSHRSRKNLLAFAS